MIGFIHIPKCAGSSIKHWFNQHQIPFHQPRHQQLQELTDDQLNLAQQWFTVVRNPFDRMISQYEFCFVKSTRMLSKYPEVPKNLIQYQEILDLYHRGFSAWLRNYHTFNPRVLLTQSSYITDTRVASPPLVLKFEQLDDEWKTIQQLTNCYEPLPHIKVTDKTLDNYFTRKDQKYVIKHYQEDFERFGYSQELI